MKHTSFVLLLLFCMTPLLADHVDIYFKVGTDTSKALQHVARGDSIHLYFSGYWPSHKVRDRIFQDDFKQLITGVTVYSSKASTRDLIELLVAFGSANTRTFDAINIELTHRTKKIYQLSANLSYRELSIRDTELSEDFLPAISVASFPQLQKLALVNNALGKNAWKRIKANGLQEQLTHLDLSLNDLRNDVFKIFPTESHSKLQVLKLNACNLNLKKAKDYRTSEFWEKPYFSNLTHLEISNPCDDILPIFNFASIPAFTDLDVFIGFSAGNIDKTRAAAKLSGLRNDILDKVARLDIRSTRNNYLLSTLTQFRKLTESVQAARQENIILNGERWRLATVRAALQQEKLPRLQEVLLLNAGLTEEEMMILTEEFPRLHFQFRFPKVSEGAYHAATQATYWPDVDYTK